MYLIHFETKYKHAQHYIGYTKKQSPLPRLELHRANQGARLLMVLNQLGIRYNVVRIWRFKKQGFERYLKNKKNASCFCPKCKKHLKKFTYSKSNK